MSQYKLHHRHVFWWFDARVFNFLETPNPDVALLMPERRIPSLVEPCPSSITCEVPPSVSADAMQSSPEAMLEGCPT